MRESIRNGCSIGMELLYNKFINVWAAVKKPKCMENIFATTEDFYFKSPSWLLEVIRQNRFAKLYNGKRPDGSETSERAMDEMIEVMQHKYKSMSFQATSESWIQHSYNMPLVQRCQTFVETEYVHHHHANFVEEYNKDTHTNDTKLLGKKTSRTIPSNTTPEKIIIDEILFLTNLCEEIPERNYNKKLVWSVLPRITTDIKHLQSEMKKGNKSKKRK